MRPRPTYEELDWSPPPSPGAGIHRNSHSPPRSIKWYFRRIRPYLAPLAIVTGIVFIFSQYRHVFGRPRHIPSYNFKNVDWRTYAYTQFATSTVELCNALMIFEQLDTLGSKASRVLYYPEEMDVIVHNSSDRDSWLLERAADLYDVQLEPLPIKATSHRKKQEDEAEEEVNFIPLNQTQYLRIIHLQPDISILKHIDDLFMLPASTIAMTRNYTSSTHDHYLSPHFLLIEPSERETQRFRTSVYATSSSITQALNALYEHNAMILPHRKYGLQSSEFRQRDHLKYFGNDYERWDPERALREASIISFNDYPIPKPWIMWPGELLVKMMPKCEQVSEKASENQCKNRNAWMGLYNDYRTRRKEICRMISSPAPIDYEMPSGEGDQA